MEGKVFMFFLFFFPPKALPTEGGDTNTGTCPRAQRQSAPGFRALSVLTPAATKGTFLWTNTMLQCVSVDIKWPRVNTGSIVTFKQVKQDVKLCAISCISCFCCSFQVMQLRSAPLRLYAVNKLLQSVFSGPSVSINAT